MECDRRLSTQDHAENLQVGAELRFSTHKGPVSGGCMDISSQKAQPAVPYCFNPGRVPALSCSSSRRMETTASIRSSVPSSAASSDAAQSCAAQRRHCRSASSDGRPVTAARSSSGASANAACTPDHTLWG